MTHLRDDLQPLIHSLQEIAHWHSIEALLSWDQETYMPLNAIDSRSDQSALVASLAHRRFSSDRFRGLLGEWVNLETGKVQATDLNQFELAVLREVFRDWKLATALPESFVEAFSKAKSQAQHAWQDARKRDAFGDFQPYLEKVIALTAQRAEYLGAGRGAYETLLDEYEPGLTLATLNPVLETLKLEILKLVGKIQAQPLAPVFSLKDKVWDPVKQWDFSQSILKDMGFDFTRGRLDKSAHPFSSQLHPSDVRITTRIHPHDFLEGLSSTMHECGHALYEQGLDPAYFGTPLCSAISFGIHESQSRFWENGVGKSPQFWAYYFPKLCALFPENVRESDFEAFIGALHQVKPSLIRVQADELTYNLHILIRYELEQALFAGQLKVADLPAAWNEKYQAYLGITPPSDADGVMQDVHWSCGYFGYFPTYTVGNLYAAMLLDRIREDLDFEGLLKTGQLLPIREWLKTHVHSVGRLVTAEDLMQSLTGQTLNSTAFIRQMGMRY